MKSTWKINSLVFIITFAFIYLMAAWTRVPALVQNLVFFIVFIYYLVFVIYRHTVAVKNEMILSEKSDQHKNDFQPGMSDTSHTGQIGTALYVSPELNNSGLSVLYNQVNNS